MFRPDLVEAFEALAGRALPISGTPRADGTLTLTVETHIQRCRGETRLIVPGSARAPGTNTPNPALIKAVARAHHWRDLLLSGKAPSIRAVAERADVTERYVRRILDLAFLAPDIVEAILEGRQPVEPTAARLKRMCDLPASWAEQRRLLGFA